MYTTFVQVMNRGFMNSTIHHHLSINPETKRQSKVRVFPGVATPMKFKRSRSVDKQMVASFFSKKEYIVTVPLVEQKTVTANWYVDVCILKAFEAWTSGRK